MGQYRKKAPVEAIQWFKMGDHPSVVSYSSSDGYQRGDYHPVVHTLEGVLRVTPGDWILTGVTGESWPCKPDIFEATYEQVS